LRRRVDRQGWGGKKEVDKGREGDQPGKPTGKPGSGAILVAGPPPGNEGGGENAGESIKKAYQKENETPPNTVIVKRPTKTNQGTPSHYFASVHKKTKKEKRRAVTHEKKRTGS